jgi:hypothetical protein
MFAAQRSQLLLQLHHRRNALCGGRREPEIDVGLVHCIEALGDPPCPMSSPVLCARPCFVAHARIIAQVETGGLTPSPGLSASPDHA